MSEITVDRETCIGAGMCFNVAPEVFDLDDDGKAILPGGETVPTELEPAVDEAISLCPVGAIRRAAAAV
jgi:ferredoxin